MRYLPTYFKAALALTLATSISAIAQNSCADLKNLKLDHASVDSAQWMEATTIHIPVYPPAKPFDVSAPPHCEVAVTSRPTSDSEIHFLLWLPAEANWNGKYLQRGNGGWAGFIQPSQLISPLARGYAASATDDGHRDDQPQNNSPTWANGHPEKLIDFGYRALHETATLSKSILQAYYSKPSSHAYFQGCSDGGREALMEAERYPEDFDGIIAGAPANHWTHHFAGFLWNEMALEAKSESSIAPAQLPAIERAALAACDQLDGVKDGLIEDPRQCHFDPSVLLCHASPSAECLTQPQINALNKIYSGPKDPRTGEQIYPGYPPGTEGEPGAWVPWIIPGAGMPTSLQASFGNGLFSQVVHEDATWDWRTFDLTQDTLLADQKAAPILNSWNPDLRSFRAHGGKLIQYHGWGDAAISPLDSINFYNQVTDFLTHYPDPRSTSPTDVQAFYRLFMVPGMGHCAGGPGPSDFGNSDPYPDGKTPTDADRDVLLALDRWVTKGIAPEKLIGTGKTSPGAGATAEPITRPLCPYPQVAHYKGQGNPNTQENFTCTQPPSR